MRPLEVVTAQPTQHGVGDCDLWSVRGAVRSKQRMMQAARLAGSWSKRSAVMNRGEACDL